MQVHNKQFHISVYIASICVSISLNHIGRDLMRGLYKPLNECTPLPVHLQK